MRHLRHLPWLALLVVFFTACGAEPDASQPDACDGITPVCTAAADCGGNASCDACGRCIPASCNSSADCPGDLACIAGACVAAECTSDASCGDGLVCIEGVCVADDCAKNGCPDGKTCREQDNACVECIDDGACNDPAAPFCETDAGTCVGCRDDGDCGGDRCGAENTCVACVSNEDCGGATPTCRVDVGVCGTCGSDADCPGSYCRDDATCWPGPQAGEACNANGTCAAGFICTGETCSQLCDLYELGCPSGTACELLAANGRALFSDGEPLAACLDTSSGAGVERPCGGDVFCRAGLFCVPTSADGGTCKPYCEPGGDARYCATGDVCVAVSLGTNGEDVGLCNIPNSWLETCTVNEDCDTGQGCAPFVEDRALVGRCQFSAGTGAPLAACDDEADCRSGFCLPMSSGSTDGVCWGGCVDDASCGAGNFCLDYTFTIDTGTATYPGCRAGCLNDSDCSDHGAGSVCGIAAVDNQLIGICLEREGPAGPGATCTENDACGTGLCFSNEDVGHPADDGFCLGTCEVDADCGGNTLCRTVALNAGTQAAPMIDTIDICWGQACDRNGDCPAGWSCGLETDPADPENELRTSCGPSYGSGVPGQACTAHTACANGLCADFGFAQVCWGPCLSDTDCFPGTTCQPVIFNGTSEQTACLP